MLTFFTTAKALREHRGIVQRNALKSWKLLDPDVELIVFGEDEGAAEVCSELGLVRRAVVERLLPIPEGLRIEADGHLVQLIAEVIAVAEMDCVVCEGGGEEVVAAPTPLCRGALQNGKWSTSLKEPDLVW